MQKFRKYFWKKRKHQEERERENGSVDSGYCVRRRIAHGLHSDHNQILFHNICVSCDVDHYLKHWNRWLAGNCILLTNFIHKS